MKCHWLSSCHWFDLLEMPLVELTWNRLQECGEDGVLGKNDIYLDMTCAIERLLAFDLLHKDHKTFILGFVS